MPVNPHRPKQVTKKLRHAWQKFVDRIIKTDMTKGMSQEDSIQDALDKRDAHILAGDKITKKGKIIKKK